MLVLCVHEIVQKFSVSDAVAKRGDKLALSGKVEHANTPKFKLCRASLLSSETKSRFGSSLLPDHTPIFCLFLPSLTWSQLQVSLCWETFSCVVSFDDSARITSSLSRWIRVIRRCDSARFIGDRLIGEQFSLQTVVIRSPEFRAVILKGCLIKITKTHAIKKQHAWMAV